MKKVITLIVVVVLVALMTPFTVGAEAPQNEVTRLLSEYAQTLPSHWRGGGQCYGFVKYTYQQLFDVTVTWSYDSGKSTDENLYVVDSITDPDDLAALYAAAQPGDILCWSSGGNSPHSTIVYDKADGMVVLDANSDGAGIIRINRTYTHDHMYNWLASGRTRRISLFRLSPGNVSISTQHVMAGVGKTVKITVRPDIAAYVTPEWYSSDDTVATVGQDGAITGRSAGTAVISCVYGDRVVDCSVTVYDIFRIDSALEMQASTLFARSEHQLVITLNGDGPYENEEIVWTSSDDGIATVNKHGLIVAKKEGSAVIKAAFVHNGIEYELDCHVQVTSAI